jgi:predicted nucleic acid-binding protein
LAVLLYLETNFLLAFSTGRDPDAARLLQMPAASVRITIPDICLMEAHHAIEGESRPLRAFEGQIAHVVNQLSRSQALASVPSWIQKLNEARASILERLDDLETRFAEALDSVVGRCELLELTPDAVRESLAAVHIDQPKDNLVLCTILDHARRQDPGERALLSGDTRDFGQPQVQAVLLGAGIAHRFTTAGNFLGWMAAQPGP